MLQKHYILPIELLSVRFFIDSKKWGMSVIVMSFVLFILDKEQLAPYGNISTKGKDSTDPDITMHSTYTFFFY